MRPPGNRGAVLVEAVVSMLIVTMAVGMNAELSRRIRLAMMLQHGAFLFARERALGAGWESASRPVRRFLERASGAGQSLARRVRLSETPRARGLEANLHYRFRAWMRFPYAGGTKHHFEVTRRCLFPF